MVIGPIGNSNVTFSTSSKDKDVKTSLNARVSAIAKVAFGSYEFQSRIHQRTFQCLKQAFKLEGGGDCAKLESLFTELCRMRGFGEAEIAQVIATHGGSRLEAKAALIDQDLKQLHFFTRMTESDMGTAMEVDSYVRTCLKAPEQTERKAEFKYEARQIEVYVDPKTRQVFFKNKVDEVLGRGTYKTAVVAYDYFQSRDVVVLKSNNQVVRNTVPSEELSDQGTLLYTSNQGTFLPTDEADNSSDDSGTSICNVTMVGGSAAKKLVELVRAAEAKRVQVYNMDYTGGIDEAEEMKKSRDKSLISSEGNSPLSNLNDREREEFFSRDLAGLEGLMTSLYVTPEGEMFQERCVSVDKVLKKGEHALGMESCFDIMSGVFTGLVNLHEKKGYIHRDLKLENFLFRRDLETGKYHGVISDFGSVCHAEGDVARMEYYATPRYASPEINAEDVEHIGQETDIWSMGLIMYELFVDAYISTHPLFTELPEGEGGNLAVKEYVASFASEGKVRQDYLKTYPEPDSKDSLEHLIWQCLRPEPAERPKTSELKEKFSRLKDQIIALKRKD